jgi:NADP-dependent 3-hydroxy acid dehydrogenase YdfG
MIDKRNVLITGASSGIGRAIANSFLEQGCKVAGVARDFNGADQRLDQIELDLSDLDELTAQLSDNVAFDANVDTLILNAGYGQFGGIEQFSHRQIEQLINTNLVSNIFLLKHFLPKFRKRGEVDIVFIGSESGLQGAKQGAVYCASKFAVRGLAQSLRADCANSDIRVMLVNPGPVNSDFFEHLHFQPEHGADYAVSVESIAESVCSALSQPRNVVTEEINIQPIKRAFRKK